MTSPHGLPPWLCCRVPGHRQAASLGPADLLQRLRVITDGFVHIRVRRRQHSSREVASGAGARWQREGCRSGIGRTSAQSAEHDQASAGRVFAETSSTPDPLESEATGPCLLLVGELQRLVMPLGLARRSCDGDLTNIQYLTGAASRHWQHDDQVDPGGVGVDRRRRIRRGPTGANAGHACYGPVVRRTVSMPMISMCGTPSLSNASFTGNPTRSPPAVT